MRSSLGDTRFTGSASGVLWDEGVCHRDLPRSRRLSCGPSAAYGHTGSVDRGLGELPATASAAPIRLPEVRLLGGVVTRVVHWRRRHQDFPAPVAQLKRGLIWKWSGVER